MALRTLLLSVLAFAALVAAGCGNRQEIRTLGETEGAYVDVADLSYQVQLSRILNPNDIEDQAYLVGLPEGVAPARDETWFAIFMRVSNPTDRAMEPARSFRIVDTQENEFTPVPIDTEANPFAYNPDRSLEPGAIMPDPNSISGEGDIQGALILFKIKIPSLNNRPLELEIESPTSPAESSSATIDLDV